MLTIPKKQDENSGHPKAPALSEIRSAIPTHCFHKSHLISFGYLFRDVVYVSALVFGALQIPSIQSAILRTLSWVAYGLLQGFVFTGIWILGHECGHGAFSSNAIINDVVGWTLHSALLVPYFSWKITHARHHRYTGHMEKDTAFVPLTQAEYAKKGGLEVTDLADLMQDTPLKTLVTLIGHQLAGWQIYLFTYATGGEQSGAQGTADNKRIPSHFDPYSPLFTRQQRSAVVLSDIGISIMFIILFYMGKKLGVLNICGLYFMPYLWTHHWLGKFRYRSDDRSPTDLHILKLQSPISITPIRRFHTTAHLPGHSRKGPLAQWIAVLASLAGISSMI